jgi:hypothetical protein
MAKSEKRIIAIQFRKEGRSIKSIAKELLVSPSSVSSWCKEVVLTDAQIKQLEINSKDPHYGRRLDYALKQQKMRLDKTAQLNILGREAVGDLSKRELLLVGTALYWAEGYKKDHQAGLGSSDPLMMKLYVKWLKECFDYSIDDLLFRVTVNEAHAYRIDKIVEYWANIFEIGVDRFQKPFYQHVKWKKVYENSEDYYGVLRIRPRKSIDLLRRIMGMIEGLKNNADFS